MEAPAPWERQPGEPARAYEGFCRYRDLPPRERSLKAVAERLGHRKRKKRGTSLKTVARWSSRWRWVERAKAWDEEQDRQAREAQLKAVREMRERHAREAMALQEKALRRLKDMNPSELDPGDVLRYFIEAAKLERIARGEPETVQEQRHSLTGWAQAVLEAFRRRASKGDTGE